MNVERASACRSCGAKIVWAQTESGRPIPIDAEPTPNGNIKLQIPDDPRDPPVSRVLRKGESRSPPTYVSHFATCPNAGEHRKEKA